MSIEEKINQEIENQRENIDPSVADVKLLTKAIKIVMDAVNDIVPKMMSNFVDCIPGGSSSRKTFLPGKKEIDIYVRINTTSIKDLEFFAKVVIPELGRKMGVVTELRYSQNPYGYFKFKVDTVPIEVDLVAVVFAETYEKLLEALKISGMARTPFHSLFLNDKIIGIEHEIRTFKYWLKKKRCYGRSGITGYLAELLIIKYRKFTNILKEISSLIEKPIDPWNRSEKELDKIFPQDIIIVVDPTDKNRNVAAGIQGYIGKIKLERIIRYSKEAFEKPKEIFDPLVIPKKNIKLTIVFSKEPANDDDKFLIMGRIAGKIKNEAEFYQYSLVDVYIEPERNEIIIIPEKNSFKKEWRILSGPPLDLEDSVAKFRLKNKEVWIENGRIMSKKPNKYKNMVEIIEKVTKKIQNQKKEQKSSIQVASLTIEENS